MKDVEFWSAAQLRTSFHDSSRKFNVAPTRRFHVEAFEVSKIIFKLFSLGKNAVRAVWVRQNGKWLLAGAHYSPGIDLKKLNAAKTKSRKN